LLALEVLLVAKSLAFRLMPSTVKSSSEWSFCERSKANAVRACAGLAESSLQSAAVGLSTAAEIATFSWKNFIHATPSSVHLSTLRSLRAFALVAERWLPRQ
jgi:hypothetical protein